MKYPHKPWAFSVQFIQNRVVYRPFSPLFLGKSTGFLREIFRENRLFFPGGQGSLEKTNQVYVAFLAKLR